MPDSSTYTADQPGAATPHALNHALQTLCGALLAHTIPRQPAKFVVDKRCGQACNGQPALAPIGEQACGRASIPPVHRVYGIHPRNARGNYYIAKSAFSLCS